jgi:leucyl aminopeptidase
MNTSKCATPLALTPSDAVVVGLFSGEKLGGAAAEADRAAVGLLTKLVERQEITGRKFELTTLLAPPGIAAGQLLVVGLGERAKFDAGVAYRAAAAAA